MTKKQIKQYYLTYTVAAVLMLAIIYAPFAASGKTFVYREDGVAQHCRALIYCGEWLREIGRTLVTEHRLVIPEWDFSIGLGANILTTLNYYAIGDPLNLFTAFVPARYMPYFFSFLVLVRNYLSGLAFSAFCIYMKKSRPMGILAGAITYMLCSYALYAGTVHPFFVNPMIYFPLVLLGVEKVFRREKPWVLIVSVCVSAVSNFYFFYMIVLETIIYVLVRCICTYGWKRRREGLLMILKIGGYSLVGVLLSAVIFLPIIRTFLNDYRIEKEYTIASFYGKLYYEKLLSSFVSGLSLGAYTELGYGMPALLAVALLFLGENRKKYRAELKLLFVIGTLLLMSPLAGHILNGFSYTSNRWMWGYSMLCAYILCELWEELTAMSTKNAARLLAFSVCYTAVITHCFTMLRKTRVRYLLPSIAVALVLLAVCLFRRGKQSRRAVQAVLLGLMLAGLTQNAYRLFETRSIPETYRSAEQINAYYDGKPEKAAKKLQEESEEFFRYVGNPSRPNAAANAGTYGMNFYWSLSNGNVSDFFAKTQTYVMRFYSYRNLNERTILTTLAGNRYYICEAGKTQNVPYGYRKVDEQEGCVIYENENVLPLGYCYDSYITEEEASAWNGAQREEAMAQSIILETEAGKELQSKDGQIALAGREIALYTTKTGDGVTETERGFTVDEKGGTAVFHAEETGKEGEFYLCMEGYGFEGKGKQITLSVNMVTASGKEVSREMFYETKKSKWPSGIEDFTVNLGCPGEEIREITITFPLVGKYSFDRIYLWNQPLTDYEQQMNALRKDHLVNEQIETNRVSGDITLEDTKILCLAIPWDGGWTAYVDGEKQPLLKANYMFGALVLPEGEHHIELRYRTPWMNAGLLLTIIGVLILIGIALYDRRKEKPVQK